MESFLDCAEHRFVYAPPTTMYCAEVNVETPFKDMLPVPTILLIFPRDVKKTINFLFYNISNFPFGYSTDCTCGVQTKFWSNGALSGLCGYGFTCRLHKEHFWCLPCDFLVGKSGGYSLKTFWLWLSALLQHNQRSSLNLPFGTIYATLGYLE